jgi:hypothetical protein
MCGGEPSTVCPLLTSYRIFQPESLAVPTNQATVSNSYSKSGSQQLEHCLGIAAGISLRVEKFMFWIENEGGRGMGLNSRIILGIHFSARLHMSTSAFRSELATVCTRQDHRSILSITTRHNASHSLAAFAASYAAWQRLGSGVTVALSPGLRRG